MDKSGWQEKVFILPQRKSNAKSIHKKTQKSKS